MYDVIIIGGGVAGTSAAIYAGNSGLKTLVIDSGRSQIRGINTLYNYPGVKEISGEELLSVSKQQALENGTEWQDNEVVDIDKQGKTFIVTLKNDETYKTSHLILATNINRKILDQIGLEHEVNKKVPSLKIRKVLGLKPNGESKQIPHLYVTGLIAGLSSQSVIAAGHGAQVAIDIASKGREKAYMWHDN